MKKPIIALMMCLPVMCFAQAGKFILKGKVANLNSPAKLYLAYNRQIADSAILHDGDFQFNGIIEQPVEAYLSLNKAGNGFDNNNYVKFYLEEGSIIITGTDSMPKATITGTKNNDMNAKYQALMIPLNKRDDELYARDTSATDVQKSSASFLKELEALNKKLEADRKAINKRFILDNPSLIISLDALYSYAQYSAYNDIAALFDKLSPDVKNSQQGKAYAYTLQKMEALSVGHIAPDFELPDTNGNNVKLLSFRGEYLLLDFWASWCPLCRQANPEIVKTYNQYKNKNFTILGVSLDKPGDKEIWLKAIHHDGLLWTQISELRSWKSLIVKSYNLTALPQNFLIDPDGKIIARNLDGNQLATKLAELFGK